MKELSIEEKAKRYDEALKVLHKYDGANIMFSQSLKEEMFPELKEGEDEKVKKSLIRLVKAFYDVNFPTPEGFTKEQLLSWIEKQGENNIGISEATKQKLEDNLNMTLEKETQESWNEFLDKQGEQNLVNTDLDELVIQLEETIGTSPHSRETIKDFFQRAVQKYMNCLRIANGEIGRLVDENYSLKEKQGEQKPAEWSEDDEKKLDNVITQLKAASNIIVKDEIDDSITFIKSLKDRVQPKQEWSKEDIDMIDYLIRCCEEEHEELCNDKYGHQDIISDLKRDCRKKWDWFESLKNKVVPQSQWSEEDEKNFARVDYACLKVYGGDSYSSDWLRKFLGIHKKWKPSKEQIMALRWALNHIPYSTRKEEISGLLDQLNKLMEK